MVVRKHLCFLILVGVAGSFEVALGQVRTGIEGREAPSWSVQKWINLPSGQSELDIGKYRGRVVYLYCFQTWCPGCHGHGFPTLQRMLRRYKGRDEVAFVAIQTVFEGFESNTFAHAKKVARDYSLRIPVGQSGENGVRSELMRRYRTGGTPWTIIIDRKGVVRFNDFQTSARRASLLIEQLLKEPAGNDDRGKVPASRVAQEMIGRPLDLGGLVWINTPRRAAPAFLGKVTLLRWWTDSCPFCRRSLRAISKLQDEFAERDFQVVAVYHPKPPRHVSEADIISASTALGFRGPVAADMDWHTLKGLYLDGNDRPATSVSFLLDRFGKVRYVHPGPVFGQSDDPAERQADLDYQDIKTAIQVLLNK